MNRRKGTKLATANQPFTPLTKKVEITDSSFQPLKMNDLQTPKNAQKSSSSSKDSSELHLPNYDIEKDIEEISLDDIREYFVKGIEMIDKYKTQQKQHERKPILKSNLKPPNKINNFDGAVQFNEKNKIEKINQEKNKKFNQPTKLYDDDQDENSSEIKVQKLSNHYNERETPIEKKNSQKYSDFPLSPTNFSKISLGSPHSSESKFSESGEDIQQRMMQMSALLRRLEKQLDDLQS